MKDRVAWAIVLDAERRGALPPGGTIYEGTVGSTGISLAMVARARGYRCYICMPDDQVGTVTGTRARERAARERAARERAARASGDVGRPRCPRRPSWTRVTTDRQTRPLLGLERPFS